jgi:hypothetical protein
MHACTTSSTRNCGHTLRYRSLKGLLISGKSGNDVADDRMLEHQSVLPGRIVRMAAADVSSWRVSDKDLAATPRAHEGRSSKQR